MCEPQCHACTWHNHSDWEAFLMFTQHFIHATKSSSFQYSLIQFMTACVILLRVCGVGGDHDQQPFPSPRHMHTPPTSIMSLASNRPDVKWAPPPPFFSLERSADKCLELWPRSHPLQEKGAGNGGHAV